MSSKENLEMQVLSCSVNNEGNAELLGIHINNLNHVNQLRKKPSMTTTCFN